MRKTIIISVLFLLLLACTTAMDKHREQISSGLLATGLNRDAFLKEWGMPDRTSVMTIGNRGGV
jgi:hypothetical protein